jgi:hypothetical protein
MMVGVMKLRVKMHVEMGLTRDDGLGFGPTVAGRMAVKDNKAW